MVNSDGEMYIYCKPVLHGSIGFIRISPTAVRVQKMSPDRSGGIAMLGAHNYFSFA